MNFASDNVEGASPPVLRALIEANEGALAAYGNDAISTRVHKKFSEIFGRAVEVAFAATGTAANALALASLTPPWGAVLCHEESHVADDECGAPEFFTHGAKLIGLPGTGGKLSLETVAAAIARIPDAEKAMQPAVLSLTQATEAGLVYTREEIAALAALAHEHGIAVHMDGARFANALVSLDCTPAEMTWKVGVDVLSFGATKNGCLAAEAIVIFDKARLQEVKLRRKRGGHTLSKGRLIAAQLEGYLTDDHWLDNARHANAMARRLAEGLIRSRDVRLAWPVQANEVFPIMPKSLEARLREAGFLFYGWDSRYLPPGEQVGKGEAFIRLVTSFATKAEDVDRFVGTIAQMQAA